MIRGYSFAGRQGEGRNRLCIKAVVANPTSEYARCDDGGARDRLLEVMSTVDRFRTDVVWPLRKGRFFRLPDGPLSMSHFTVTGRFKMRGGYATFEKHVEAENERVAREHVLSRLGSEHGLKRTQIELAEVEAQ